MQTTIDVTGLPETVIHEIEQFVDTFRKKQADEKSDTRPDQKSIEERVARFRAWAESHHKQDVVEPPNVLDPEAWSARLRNWAASHPKREIVIDDSRETIYEGRGE